MTAIRRVFCIDGWLNKLFVGLFALNGFTSYYYALALDCTSRNCGGASGATFWFALNLALVLAHFSFWVRNESDEFSRYFVFRVVCVSLSLAMHLTIFFLFIPGMRATVLQ